MDFALKMMGFALKMMNFALKMMVFALKMMNFALKMMGFLLKAHEIRLKNASCDVARTLLLLAQLLDGLVSHTNPVFIHIPVAAVLFVRPDTTAVSLHVHLLLRTINLVVKARPR